MIFNTIQHLLFPKFLSEDQIIKDYIKKLSDLDKQAIINIAYESLILFHHSAGRDIRNRYKLWNEKNPYTQYNGDPNADNHPDQMSCRILQEVWKKLH